MSGQDIGKDFQAHFLTGIFNESSLKNHAGCESKLRLLPALSFIVSAMIRNAETLLKRLLSHISSSARVKKYCKSPWVFQKLLAPNCRYKKFA